MVSTVPPRSASDDQAAASAEDWPAQVADSIERLVGSVRDKTTGPALTVAKAIVYGTFAAIVGFAAFVLLVIAAVRLVNNYLPDAIFGETHMWAADLLVGLVLVIIGGILWSRRRAAEHGPRY